MFWFTDKHLEEIMKYKTSKKTVNLQPDNLRRHTAS